MQIPNYNRSCANHHVIADVSSLLHWPHVRREYMLAAGLRLRQQSSLMARYLCAGRNRSVEKLLLGNLSTSPKPRVRTHPQCTSTDRARRRRSRSRRPVRRTRPADSSAAYDSLESGERSKLEGLEEGAGLVGHVASMTSEDSRLLLRRLMIHATAPENTAVHQWTAGDLVIWDNLSVLHRADTLGIPGQGTRLLHRISVKGKPVFKLPRRDNVQWLEQHVRGYSSPASALQLA